MSERQTSEDDTYCYICHPDDPNANEEGCAACERDYSRHVARQHLAEAAAWVAESIGYPVETRMPDHPIPRPLWDALVDHIHADESGKWHGNELSREETESWLANEAGRGSA